MRNTRATQLLFDLSRPGCVAVDLPACDVPQRPLAELLPSASVNPAPLPLPELSEPDVVRHFVNLSTQNMSVDTHFYPLGSCTMKYNPKRNERLASMPGMVDVHPYQPEATVQGLLEILHESQYFLAEISGLPAVSLQPAAGAHGEMTALLVAAAYFRDLGQKRTTVLIPDGAHGTNPASAAMAGFAVVPIKCTSDGFVDLAELASHLNDKTAVFMITNPNTLGIFEPNIKQIVEMVHAVGALVYLDGANMNAILGLTRPGDFGADMQHYNPHKTFSGPHGGGGPGAGPITVRAMLEPFLPSPVVARDGERYRLAFDRPRSIGRVRSFFGNVGVLVRAYAYIRTHGPDGLRRVAENAVLNANYVLKRLEGHYERSAPGPCMHECVLSARGQKRRGAGAGDIARRLLDLGFYAPTTYFPLVVEEALMIEPTETESKETLDEFCDAMIRIAREAESNPELVRDAPATTPVRRLDQTLAARQPRLRWTP
jgi:glycine dehydrogenase subunit 2